VQQFRGPSDPTAEGDREGLVSEAHPEQRDATRVGDPHRIDRCAGVGRMPGTGRDDDRVGLGDGGQDVRVVCRSDGDVRPQIGHVSGEGVHEAVAVVDDDHAEAHSTVTSCG
jgi:ApbE superfamily uncharacterized protein (UPF0280 family)